VSNKGLPRDAIVYTGGTFDLFHCGHVRFLRQCSFLARIVVVSLNTDDFVESFKGKPPVMSFDERREILLSSRSVAAVVRNIGGADSRIAIDVVAPDIIAIGSDWESKDYYSQMGFTRSWLDERGIDVVYLPYTEGISSTDVKRRVGDHLR